METKGLKAAISALAQQHGFDLGHVTEPCVDILHADSLQQWVDNGFQGEMAWMGEAQRLERRKNPASLMMDVRSVISVAMRYSAPAYTLSQACAGTDRGVITAYAHGDDYHDVMKKRLKAFASDLDELLGIHDQRVFVDTAPVLEHALAESAGLGWQGKHSLTIHRELGSWFLLGEIFTTAEIEPDEPASNHCGSCTACIDVCPTRAIVAPYVVDARLCISYLTIEFSGFIPLALRPLMGSRIYGCDDCQMVCPWNEHAGKGKKLQNDLLKPRGENVLPELASLLRLDEEGFRQRFRKSPVKRTKRRGLLRNVCIAMGNSGYAGFVPQLISVLHDAEALIRGHAVWALGELADSCSRGQIMKALKALDTVEKEMDVRNEIEIAIQRIRNSHE